MSPIFGISGIVFCMWYVFNAPHSGFNGFLDKPAIILVGICPPSIMLLSHTLQDFGRGIFVLARALFRGQSRTHKEVINILTHASALVRSEGIGALMKIRDKVAYELLRDGISLILNDFTVEEIRHNLNAKINAKQSHMAMAANLFENMSKICPGVGMMGTLIGLINMLSNMADPSRIGSGMAMAMVTTLYGLLLGTTIYGPFGEKIAIEAEKNLEIDLMVLEGVLLLKGKKSSIHLKDIMKTYGSRSSPNQPAPAPGAPAKKGA